MFPGWRGCKSSVSPCQPQPGLFGVRGQTGHSSAYSLLKPLSQLLVTAERINIFTPGPEKRQRGVGNRSGSVSQFRLIVLVTRRSTNQPSYQWEVIRGLGVGVKLVVYFFTACTETLKYE